MNIIQKNNRLHGLDALRATAIILVFMTHYSKLIGPDTFGSFGRIGWTGVDLFFVLSGYLIGNQVFSSLIKSPIFSLKLFYSRRFLRTLPNYFLVLALYFLIPEFSEAPLVTPLWKFLTFTQNFNLYFCAFSHAWSLCIEEQFYLVLPIIAILLARSQRLYMGWSILLVLFLTGMLLRGWLWLHYIQHDPNNTDFFIHILYYPTYVHLDGLLFGIAMAMLKNFHPKKWDYALTKGNLFLVLGLLGCCFAFFFLQNAHAFLQTIFGYSILAVCFSALVLAALSPHTLLYRIKIPGALTLATWSYAIYLTHKEFIHLTHFFLSHWAIGQSGYIAVPLTILVCLIAGALLYYSVEKPFLNLRDKIRENKISEINGLSKQAI